MKKPEPSKRAKTLAAIPRFADEAEERAFWATHDSTDYVDWSRARRLTLPNLKPSTETISLRLPEALLVDLKVLANVNCGYRNLEPGYSRN